MKLNGKKIESPYEDVVIFPRKDSQIVLKVRAVMDFEPFDQACPEPKPPTKMLPGGTQVPDLTDAKYLKNQEGRGEKRMAWMVIKSLEATKGLEWETVKLLDAETWLGYEKELKDSGFSQMEVMRIITAVMEVNSLNEDKIREARERFLAEEAAKPPA